MLHRVELKWRFRNGTNSFRVTVPGGGAVSTIQVATSGWAEDFADLALAVNARLLPASADFSCTVTDTGKVTIAHSSAADFTIDWDDKSLAEALGFTGAQLSGADSYVSAATSPLVFLATVPWSGDTTGLMFARKSPRLYRDVKRSISLARARTWNVVARATGAEVAQWRRVAALLANGAPARWFRNTTNLVAWSWTNFDGYVDVALSADSDALVDGWPGLPLRQHLVQELRFVEWLNTSVSVGWGG